MFSRSRRSLAWKPRKGVYSNSNGTCTFNPISLEGLSYDWWLVVRKVGPYVLFNDYRYSTTTSGHQRMLRGLLEELGIQISHHVEAPGGLQDLERAAEYHASQADYWSRRAVTGRSRKSTYLDLAASHEAKSYFLMNLMLGADRRSA